MYIAHITHVTYRDVIRMLFILVCVYDVYLCM